MPSRCRLHWPLRLIALLPLLLINSCDRDVPVGGEGVITLRFWNGFTGPDGRTMLRIVQRFNRENPHVHVVMQRIDWATYYNKLFVARLGGRGPDVFVLHTDSVTRFVYAGFLRPCDDLIGDGGLDANDFDANVWQSVAFDGKHYAIPLDVHPLGMYYNRTLFKKAGIVDAAGNAKPPTNRQEFLDACQRITNHEKGSGASCSPGSARTCSRSSGSSAGRSSATITRAAR
jgi:multiple sugar transport system substrate-binding protein